MATRTIHQVVDDLDGNILSEAEGETIKFGLDGYFYEIDLSNQNAEKLRSTLNFYINSARQISAKSTGRKSANSSASIAKIREWALFQGLEVSERGRISKSIVEAYNSRSI